MENNKLAIIGGLIGLILALLLITVGFLKTILVILLVTIGATIGFLIQKKDLIDHFR